MAETLIAIRQVKIGKAAGVDGTPSEEKGELPPDIRDAVIITCTRRTEKSQTVK
uniref:60S ribosomal protein L12 n=1 Tax=Loa loa TaxID=7209 RepID=A0A1I7VV62_LOALO